MDRGAERTGVFTWVVAASAIAAVFTCAAPPAHAAPLDRDGEIQLGVRAYTAARVGTEGTDRLQQRGIESSNAAGERIRRPEVTKQSLTFPVSSAGSLRQHRSFIEVDWSHNLDRLVYEGWGPLGLLNALPFPLRRVSYRLTYRGEHEGLYDWGPAEFRTAEQYRDTSLVPLNSLSNPRDPIPIDVGSFRRDLRRHGSDRHRLFQAYVQASAGKLFVRLGRQILVWGETDVFRLLDNINPMDPSFGGFLVPLDERRVPLDMLLLRYNLGRIQTLGMRDVSVEAYGVVDSAVGFAPGIRQGSAWAPPNLGAPSALVTTQRVRPARNFSDMRGGARARWGMRLPGIRSADFSLAHYYTYFDTPGVHFQTNRDFPSLIPEGQVGAGSIAVAIQTAPLVQVTGASTTFAVPQAWVRPLGISAEPIIRAEVAYFKDEPRFRQSEIDPFQFALSRSTVPHPVIVEMEGPCPPENLSADGRTCVCPGGQVTADGVCRGRRRTGDSWNAVLGMDFQQWIRWLNPDQSFFITTQFFYKHLNGAAGNQQLKTRTGLPTCGAPGVSPTATCFADPLPGIFEGEVLPVPEYLLIPQVGVFVPGVPPAAPRYVRSPTDQIVNTLFIMTSYFGGRVNPAFGLIYDWQGALVVQPQLMLSHDPFRFTVNYSHLTANRLRGGSGVSLLRDRDNVLFQIEYAL